MNNTGYCLLAEDFKRGKKVATYTIAHLPLDVEGKIIARELSQFCEEKQIPRVYSVRRCV